MTTPPKPKRPSVGFILGKSGTYAVLILGLVATLLPFFYIMVSSLKTEAELRKTPPDFFPQEPTLKHYITILTDERIPIERNVMNSVIVSVARVVITLFTSSFAGYIFAKYHFKGKSLAFGVILIQIMIPFQVVMIPNYLLVVKFGLIDSLWALIVPTMVDAYGIFMMKQFIESMPGELMDAARIDGASEFGIYSRIILPQMGPPLASLGIFTFMATWNDYHWPSSSSPRPRSVPSRFCWSGSKPSTPPIKVSCSPPPFSRSCPSSSSTSSSSAGSWTRRLNRHSNNMKLGTWNLKRLLHLFLLSSFLMGCQPAASSPEPATVPHTFAPSDASLLNPERGFFTPYELPGTPGFSPLRATGNTLVHLNIRLDDWRGTDIPQETLDGLDTNFSDIRDAGVKAIIRFAYNQGPYPDSEPDASKSQILRHIEQLTPLLQKNTDVIAWVEAGFIGAWGEWHTSTNGLDNLTDKRDILNTLLAAIPNRYRS
ncbi:MAG: DUF4874 domain-containing protein, partial [Anaerolineales bacterium]|nr:DUF4874 domain-containing protein [Anaerolineales bacterium]